MPKEFEVIEDYNLIEEEAERHYKEYEQEACLETEGLTLFRDAFFNLFNNDGHSTLTQIVGILVIVSVLLILTVCIFSF